MFDARNNDETRGMEILWNEMNDGEYILDCSDKDFESDNGTDHLGEGNSTGELMPNREIYCPNLSFLSGDEDENDYHNKNAETMQKDEIRKAIEICDRGLEKFPSNMNLFSHAIKYSLDIGDVSAAEKYLDQLNERVPRNTWNGRTYTTVLDFLMRNPFENEKMCREIIADYKKNLPYEEGSAVAESKLEEKLGNHEKSKEILAQAIKERFNAPQSALRLLDLQLRHGEFKEALRTSDYFLIASCEAKPSTNTKYQLYIRCLTEDAILHKKYFEDGSVSEDEVERIKGLYEKILGIPELEILFGSNIDDRMIMLDFIKTGNC